MLIPDIVHGKHQEVYSMFVWQLSTSQDKQFCSTKKVFSLTENIRTGSCIPKIFMGRLDQPFFRELKERPSSPPLLPICRRVGRVTEDWSVDDLAS
jgi:hypothetical protein